MVITQPPIYADYHGYFFFCYHITTRAQRGKGTMAQSKVKNPGPEDQALAIPGGDLFCMKKMNPGRLRRRQRRPGFDLSATLSLARRTGVRRSFFKHKTPGQSHLSLTWPKGPGFLGHNKNI